jgi:hypothetical protein
MGPCTAHKMWVLPTCNDAEPSACDRDDNSADSGRSVVGDRLLCGEDDDDVVVGLVVVVFVAVVGGRG